MVIPVMRKEADERTEVVCDAVGETKVNVDRERIVAFDASLAAAEAQTFTAFDRRTGI